MGTYIGPGVWEIDTLLGGWSRMTAGYLIEGPAPVLVETGSQTSVPALLAALEEHGVAPDRPGRRGRHPHPPRPRRRGRRRGPGLSRRPPCTCTRRAPATWSTRSAWSARPARSTATSSTRSTDGSTPPRPSGIHVLADGETIEIGPGRTLTTVDSPGHAKHHLALHDSESGILFAGDAVGVRLPDAGVLRPATPPADFDLDQAVTSLRKFRARDPAGVALAHYGLLPDPLDMLEEAEGILRRWAEVAEKAWRAGRGHRRRPR